MHLDAREDSDAVAAEAPHRGILHHVELQLLDLAVTWPAFDWLLGELGYEPFQEWPGGRSWRLGATYLVLAAAPGATPHDRRGAGLSHLAFHAGTRGDVDRLWEAAPEHHWRRLYADRHPYAGGGDHYAAFLENAERFKVELVAG
ncbi:glyoxalase [Microbacterium sp. B35-04]|uniref:VOC family protein n=1 Tax=Microbacterium sp. B35-04 TaxID=1961716 RepID=UPI0013D0E693|nr:VOC family protein [Microbacterium sp. B35-04]KAF2412273.1 glyoxalase [Microbacterium sp. B35-04]